jgi:tetratricopeptide (TPR) repeat protein
VKPIPKKNKQPPLPLQVKPKSPMVLAIPIAICIITVICFNYTFGNQFLFWDDNQFILNNIHLRRLSWENIKFLFSHEFGANWQPLTMLSYSLNYYFSKYTPFGYFFTNVLLHVANTALVFFVIRNLMDQFRKNAKPEQSLIIAGITALWFGIHPMHVESVGWLFERKDVLYTFFYLAGLLTYLAYLNNKKLKWLVLVFVLFVCACMSKPMAVVFPASLILIDFLLSRKFNFNAWIEKAPFFILSLIIGVLTLHTQKEAHAFEYTFTLSQRFFIASYSFFEYIVKLLYPLHLSGFYPYPMNPGESLPGYFYLRPVLVLLVTALPLYYTFKNNKTWFRVLAFGLGFYLVNIALVLQFLSVGSAIISDRYSYMSYIGLLLILAYFMNELFQKNNVLIKNAVVIGGLVFSIYLGYFCYERTQAWHDTEAMLTDVINQYPEKVPQAYKYLGVFYGESNRPEDAYKCYDVLINKMHLRDADAYCNMGSVLMSLNNLKGAAQYLTISLQIDSNQFMSYRNLGIINADTGNYPAAFYYYNKAKSIYPYDEGLYNNISFAHVATKQYAEAVKDYNILLQMNPDNALYYFNRGVAEYSMGKINDAADDFSKTLAMPVMKQNTSYNLPGNAAYKLSVIYKDKGDAQKADEFAKEAQRLGHQ